MSSKKVFVGMSGGVDSSVSAALLKERGFDVIGVFIKTWSPDWHPCDWEAERRDAMRVASKLETPLITLDLSKEYKREVVDYMLAEYKLGRTPNPDVMCNKVIKFGAFYDWALKEGADFVATGHYADADGENLLTAKDTNKDQTYFLWQIRKGQMPHILFPVGGLLKNDVRYLAHKFDLPVAEKKDSQGLCFMGQIDVKDFLRRELDPELGNVLDEKGEVIGKHDGAILYTIGERHGFTHQDGEPMFVKSKDIASNTITVSPSLQSRTLLEGGALCCNVTDCNWLAAPRQGKKYEARIRYRQKLVPCTIQTSGLRAEVTFETEVNHITPGQSLVAYDGNICLGGGIIETTAFDNDDQHEIKTSVS